MSITSQIITSSHALMKGDTVMIEERRGQVDTEDGQITVVELRIERSISKISSGQRQDAVYNYEWESHTRQEHKTVETDMLEDELEEFEAFWERKWDPKLIMDPANPDDRDPAKIEVLSYMPDNAHVLRVSRMSKSSATRTSVALNQNVDKEDKKESSGKKSHHKKYLESTSNLSKSSATRTPMALNQNVDKEDKKKSSGKKSHHKKSLESTSNLSESFTTRTPVALNQNLDKEDKKKSSGKKSHHKKYPRSSTSTGHHHK